MSTVGVVDVGLSNLDSARRALEECGADVRIVTEGRELAGHERIVLPGVGAFPDAMRRLRAAGIETALQELVADGRTPVLGICLGMQLLAATGTEIEPAEGLGLVPADVVRLPSLDGERLPHIGWNEVDPVNGSPLFDGLPDGADFYFVHSFAVRCDEPGHVAATTPYGGGFCSAVENGLVFGVQFHPEKSQRNGFAVLRNFLAL